MVETREYKSEYSVNALCETYSTLGKNLIQQETGIIYGDSVVDVIDHYEGGSPVSRFTYSEEDSSESEVTPEEFKMRIEAIL